MPVYTYKCVLCMLMHVLADEQASDFAQVSRRIYTYTDIRS